jgi:hypothetical protein
MGFYRIKGFDQENTCLSGIVLSSQTESIWILFLGHGVLNTRTASILWILLIRTYYVTERRDY